jgi:hypothetical protein
MVVSMSEGSKTRSSAAAGGAVWAWDATLVRAVASKPAYAMREGTIADGRIMGRMYQIHSG